MKILELKYTISNRNKSLDGLSIRMEMTEKRASELQNRSIEIVKSEQHRKTCVEKTEMSNVGIIGMPEGEGKEIGAIYRHTSIYI